MHQPDPSNEDASDFSDLERQLSRLIPAPPSAAAQRRMDRQLDGLAIQRRETRQMWWRFAPVAAAACIALSGILLVQRQLARTGGPEALAPIPSQAAADPVAPNPDRAFVSPTPVVTGIPVEHFMPVSSQEIYRDTREGRVVELPNQLRAREIRVDYEDAWHWHDPDTRTNIRIIRPREEIFLVPVQTD